MPLFAPGLDPELVDQTVLLARIMFPIVVLLGLTGLVAALLQAGGRFGATAFAPVLWNVVIIGGLIAVTPFVPDDDRVTVYAVAIVVGTLAQLLYLLPSLRGLGPFPLSFGFRNPRVRQVLVLMLPVTLGLGLININLTGRHDLRHAGQRPGAARDRRRLPPLPAAPGRLQRRHRDGAVPDDLAPGRPRRPCSGCGDARLRALRQIFFMLLPASAFLLVLAEPVVRLVFQRGEFGAASTALTSEALFFFAIGLAFNGASLLVIRAFFSMQMPWLPTKVAALGRGAQRWCSTRCSTGRMGTGGIPLATSIASIVTFLVLMWLLDRELGGLHGAWVLDGVARSLLASAVSVLLAWASWRVLSTRCRTGPSARSSAWAPRWPPRRSPTSPAAQAMEMPELRSLSRLRRPLQ